MRRTAYLIKFADEVDTDVVTNEFYVDGEWHNRQTRGEVDSCQHDDEHGGRQLVAALTEHGQHDDVTGDAEDGEDEQQDNDNVEFDVTGPRGRHPDVVACHSAERCCRLLHRVSVESTRCAGNTRFHQLRLTAVIGTN